MVEVLTYMKKLFEKELNKKGQVGLSSLPNAVLLMGLAAVIGIIMVVLVDQIGTSDSVSATSAAVNITEDATTGIAEIFEQYDLIGLMIGLGVVLVVLVGVFGFLRFRQGGL